MNEQRGEKDGENKEGKEEENKEKRRRRLPREVMKGEHEGKSAVKYEQCWSSLQPTPQSPEPVTNVRPFKATS